ncbi:MAG: hypothetical protein HOH19_09420 [Kordiimonadaceae bacterium]|nr:hypothetical protein [Kordiimonadaceae bacterium]MBT6032782.1 hypothetical protein [Kordiimonadaceae bacterium]
MGVIVIKCFFHAPEAFIAKSYLNSHGIYAMLKDENYIQTNFYHSRLLGEVKLQVFKSDFEKAVKLLQNVDQEYLQKEENKCSVCRSHRTVRIYKYTFLQLMVLLSTSYIFLYYPFIVPPGIFSHLKCMACKAKIFSEEVEDELFDPSDPSINI